MSDTVIIAIISLAGTLLGTAGGIITSGCLTRYRLEQLEKKVESFTNSHTDLVSRVIKLEDTDKLLEEKIKVCNHRIEDLEKNRGK